MLHILRGCPLLHHFTPCSSHHEQIASLFALRSSLVVFSCLCKKQWLSLLCLVAYSPQAASGPAGIGVSHPLRSTLIDVCLCRHQWHCSVLESPIPIARSNTIVLCKGNHIKIPKYSNTKNFHILENGLIPPTSILLGVSDLVHSFGLYLKPFKYYCGWTKTCGYLFNI